MGKTLDAGVTTKEVLRLMAGMKQHGIAYMELPGLKLTLAPERMTSNAPQLKPPTTNPNPTDKQVLDHIAQARVEAAVQRRKKIEMLRDKVAGTTGIGVESLAQGVYEAALATKPPVG